ncbi:MAG: hypothetical protein Kow0032_15220 [Methyloligellaceae bacterium]
MPAGAETILLIFTVFAVKHAIADFFLQTPYQYLNKGRYGHPGGLLHAGIHAVLSAPVFLVLAPATLLAGLSLLLAEFVIHYHIDWLKEKANRRHAWQPDSAWFWRALGLDQLAHSLTYIVMTGALLHLAA